MFGKNYDKDLEDIAKVINNLINSNNNIAASLESTTKLIASMEETLNLLTKVQAQHRVIIQFFMHHAAVGDEAVEDMQKMMQEIIKIEKEMSDKK